ncbi:Uncharacterized conserved protein YbjT, contains NAD(P)-binding and DUF2867 domains [Cnuella takakiae]|uniref:Uncharacterized conserved protein YbjT, contains NAD(P)-binding and DUF2867 domains n=1 Tax=Cnuella takakiae TaxID=1302690 RepID=A0A1M4V6T2_9BACT|nr:NAD(P)H-binding protein [Cnuella takakiae]OLY92688.1 hypothetical protein BUE76_12925 [Cnuella takakiae]SHE64701.1 Uncharacterized conserved protein YbjT, contains NAD(P)-binding and DUF2867 domains [Cnuella takakiae]
MATALVLGATGLVGKQLTQLLLTDAHWQEVHVFVRRPTGITHPKLREHVIDFDQPGQWRQQVKGTVLFSALGTTLAAAGSKQAQYKVDYTYQYQFAAAAAANGVTHYVLVSSANAATDSFFFYSRMKGELERDISQLSFQHISIMQPGLLAGARTEKRLGEQLALSLSGALQFVPGLGVTKSIQGFDVARAMIVAARTQFAKHKVYSMKELFQLVQQWPV